MNSALQTELRQTLLALADDELILGHRVSEWCGHAPIIEEDIAFANLALDEIAHASLWYSLVAGLDGQDLDTYPDRLVYFRGPGDYRCAQLVEIPNGDWAFTIMRQYLFDLAEKVRLEQMAESAYLPLAEAAQKIMKEELYHLRHSQAWVRRLCLGTAESRTRMQAALEVSWPYTAQLFTGLEGYSLLVDAAIVPDNSELLAAWDLQVRTFLTECTLSIPVEPRLSLTRKDHTPHLETLLAEMQALPRREPDAAW